VPQVQPELKALLVQQEYKVLWVLQALQAQQAQQAQQVQQALAAVMVLVLPFLEQ
jgi:hypothetical protein